MIIKVHAPFINNIKSTGVSEKSNMQGWNQSEWSGNGTLAKSQIKYAREDN
jgi:hypothetical protein